MATDAEERGASSGPGAFGQLPLDPRLRARRPFPPPELVRAGAAAICTRDLTLGPRLIHGDRVPPPRS